MKYYRSKNLISNPKISVLLSVYNCENFLKESIDSILNQSYKSFELIIIDDGSNDKSLDIALSFLKQDNRIIIISKKNSGLASSLNHGIDIARGSYIARQDADDISTFDRLEKQLNVIKKYNFDLITSRAFVFKNKKIKISPDLLTFYLISKKTFLLNNFFIHGTFFGSSKIFKQIKYNSIYKYSQDFNFIHNLIIENKSLGIMKTPLYSLRLHSDNVSQKFKREQNNYLKKVLIKHNISSKLSSFYFFIQNRFIKYLFKIITMIILKTVFYNKTHKIYKV